MKKKVDINEVSLVMRHKHQNDNSNNQEIIAKEKLNDGRDPTTGYFKKGNKFHTLSRGKDVRAKLTKLMLDRVEGTQLKPEEVLIEIYQDPKVPVDLRLKAASKVGDYIYPKASSVEVKMETNEVTSEEQINDKIKDFLVKALGKESQPSEE